MFCVSMIWWMQLIMTADAYALVYKKVVNFTKNGATLKYRIYCKIHNLFCNIYDISCRYVVNVTKNMVNKSLKNLLILQKIVNFTIKTIFQSCSILIVKLTIICEQGHTHQSWSTALIRSLKRRTDVSINIYYGNYPN